MLSRLFIVAGLCLIVTAQLVSTSTARSRHGSLSVHGGSTHVGCGAGACDGSVRSTGSNRFQKSISRFGDGSVRTGCSSHAFDGSVRVLEPRTRR